MSKKQSAQKKERLVYIAAYRYEDSAVWQHSGFEENEDKLRQSLESRPYLNKKTIKTYPILIIED